MKTLFSSSSYNPRWPFFAFLAGFLTVAAIVAAAEKPASTSPNDQTVSLRAAGSAGKSLQLVIPIYEGIILDNPAAALREIGLARFQLAYPGPMSAPFVAWRYGNEAWTILYADSLQAWPTTLDVDASAGELHLHLAARNPASVKELKADGSWQEMARALRQQWDIKPRGPRLADRYDRINFYVHQWISEKADPPLRVDWTAGQLAAEMHGTSPKTLIHIYGFDPGSVDLGGKVFWSDNSEKTARSIIAANPKLAHLAWLNLRTYKTQIPRLGLTAPADANFPGMAKRFDGHITTDDNYAYRAVDMCLASQAWQTSRLQQFDKLADVGFKVIQLDEFPIPPVWHAAACTATGHLHKPADAGDEWAKTMAFIAKLSARAADRGILLTCEEPSAAMLPYVSGYIDRQYNDATSVYAPWNRSKLIHTAPIFSTTFGDLVTPYTDADGVDPARKPPEGWLEAHKISVAK